jgi:hypothetical protein
MLQQVTFARLGPAGDISHKSLRTLLREGGVTFQMVVNSPGGHRDLRLRRLGGQCLRGRCGGLPRGRLREAFSRRENGRRLT